MRPWRRGGALIVAEPGESGRLRAASGRARESGNGPPLIRNCSGERSERVGDVKSLPVTTPVRARHGPRYAQMPLPSTVMG